jgi:hypothetical protein
MSSFKFKHSWIAFLLTMGAGANAAPQRAPLHIDLNMPSVELETRLAKSALPITRFEQGAFEAILKLGKRNLAWLTEINSHRAQPISLFHKDELRGFPIDKPNSYGPDSINTEYQNLQSELDPKLAIVLFSEDPLPPTASVDDEVYRQWAKRTDILYQITLRWMLFEPYLDYYASQKLNDVRGYYFLSLKPDLKAYLDQYDTYSDQEKTQIDTWVLMVCWNDLQSESRCAAEQTKAAHQYYDMVMKHWSVAKAGYDSFNIIPSGVSNAATHSEGDVLVSSVVHTTDELDAFNKTNIEEEWNGLGLKFLLSISQDWNANTISWQPDVTPHANGLGGNTVVMNSRSSLDDWDTQWTIRHEYGHLLGLPDCYFEFYDPAQNAMVSYQFDVDDLMCSRKGKLTPRIVNEIKKVYF